MDLVDTLLKEAEIAPDEHYYWLNPVLTAVASEIERLRAALKEARDYLDDMGSYPEPGTLIAKIDSIIEQKGDGK